jgi:hypothetical protein
MASRQLFARRGIPDEQWRRSLRIQRVTANLAYPDFACGIDYPRTVPSARGDVSQNDENRAAVLDR